MDSVNYEINKFVLLTGAGFTRDFGGFLANEMWSWIFNNLKVGKYPKLSNLLKNDFDYESIYYKVIEDSEFNDDEKKAITDAIYYAYKKLDDKIKDYRPLGERQPIEINGVSEFIKKFSDFPTITGNNNTKVFLFTPNQDLLVERYFSSLGLVTPYVNQPTIEIYQNKEYNESTCSRTLPATDTDLGKTNSLSSSKFFYVKLHGSWNWYSSDGKKKLVIGRNKVNQINDEPVLKRYFEIFKEALSKGSIKLFVIGYGFGDEHINKVIADSVHNNNTKLYVLNPSEPEKFKNDLHSDKIPHGEILWNGLEGYYPHSLSQVFPGKETVEYQQIRDSYFNS